MCRLLILLILLVFSGVSNATDFVYRVDSRPPDVIFRDGFHSHGSNLNLQQHIRGYSCVGGSRDSAFIATTTNIDSTYSIARQFFSSSTFTGRLYRYRIRADINYYHLEPSVQFLEREGVQFTPIEHAMMRLQSEVVAMQTITPYNIEEAVELVYDRNTSMVNEGDSFSNSRYDNIPTLINPSIIPALPIPTSSARQRINAFGALLTACFSLKGVNQGDRHKMLNYDLPFYDARPVINSILQ